MDRIQQTLMQEFSLESWQVENVLALIDEGNTIPFIARYRKEKTGSMDDEVLRNFNERLIYLRNLEARKEAVLNSIEEQGKLTDELRKQIEEAKVLVEVEDLYRPYKQKRRTRATIAKEKGLEPLADLIWEQKDKTPVEELALAFVSEEKGVATAEEAIAGAKDILAERISDDAECRTVVRRLTYNLGKLTSKAKDADTDSVYAQYYAYGEPLVKAAGHRILALNRGEKEKYLTVAVEAPEDRIRDYMGRQFIRGSLRKELLEEVNEDAYKRLIAPSIENEMRADLSEKAEDGAIKVFGQNLVQLLMQAPILGKTVLGFDPGYAHGCKLAVVDAMSRVRDHAVIKPDYCHGSRERARAELIRMVDRNHVDIIAVGNGTASRESEAFVVETLPKFNHPVSYVIVNEAGASVYSASKEATEEFPDFDVETRGAVSLARRLQDPLAELVKIDPRSIGVGQYQHDMNQTKLSQALDGVVEDCVNKVGVDVNTASVPLLSYVSGINKTIAKNIVQYREENGTFTDRKQFLKVSKLGPKAFEQCAGFLRIRNGKNPLDNTAVHPESYAAAEGLLKAKGLSLQDVAGGLTIRVSADEKAALAEKLGVGLPTLEDILKELAKPGRDPRADMPAPILRTDVLAMEDLQEGMILKGTVRNITDFGAFVDIGVHQDGLVHISQLSRKFVKPPLDVVSVGDIVEVKVLSVDVQKKRIALTMRL